MAMDLITGLGITVFLTLACFLTGSLIGVLTCIGFCSSNPIIRSVLRLYNGLIIKIPPLVMLMLSALIISGDPNRGSVWIAYVGLSIYVGANLTGVFYGGVNSVAKGEIEAARTFGMSKMQTLFHIMLPQILQNIAPIYMSMFVMCTQITSVSSVIGVKDFLDVTDAMTNDVLGILLAVTCYFAIGIFGDVVIARMGKRKHISAKDYLEAGEGG